MSSVYNNRNQSLAGILNENPYTSLGSNWDQPNYSNPYKNMEALSSWKGNYGTNNNPMSNLPVLNNMQDSNEGGFFGSINKFMASETGKNIFGSTDKFGKTTGGYAGPGIALAQGLFNGYSALKNYGLAKEGLAENKKQFNLNYGAQERLINSRLADRQAARVSGSANQMSVEDYMSKYGVQKA